MLPGRKRRKLARAARQNLRSAVEVLDDGKQPRGVLANLRTIRADEAMQDEFAAQLRERFDVDPAERRKLFKLFIEKAFK
jgi:hypothetical protein